MGSKAKDDSILLSKILEADLAKQVRLANVITLIGIFNIIFAMVGFIVLHDFLLGVLGLYSSLIILLLGRCRMGYARLYRIIQDNCNSKN